MVQCHIIYHVLDEANKSQQLFKRRPNKKIQKHKKLLLKNYLNIDFST